MLRRMRVRWLARLRVTGAALAGAAVAGAVVGHALAYLVTVPDPQQRAEVLARTGHGYWAVAIAAAVVLGGFAAVTTLICHFRAGLRGGWRRQRAPAAPRVAERLAGLQVAIYVVQEVVERLAAHAPLGQLLGRELAVGVALQALVALLLAALLVWLGRAAELAGHLLAAGSGVGRSRPVPERPRSSRHVPARPPTGSLGSRAPPWGIPSP
jgi:hypothetical protein